jgi:toxin ParE1/3/4
MSRIELAPEVADDLERIFKHLTEFEVAEVPQRIGEIIQAINVLEQNPLIGRLTNESKRELVIGKQARGYIALYRYIEEIDTVFVLALRGQQEAGYAR